MDHRIEDNKEYQYCLRCGRKLKNPEARKRGYGIICEKKLETSHKSRLFEPLKSLKK